MAEYIRGRAQMKSSHEFIKTSSYIKKVQKLNDILQNEKMGTKKYNKMNRKIMRTYQASLDDKIFQNKKNEHDHLHKKLKHIKQLVAEYDITQTCGTAGSYSVTTNA